MPRGGMVDKQKYDEKATGDFQMQYVEVPPAVLKETDAFPYERVLVRMKGQGEEAAIAVPCEEGNKTELRQYFSGDVPGTPPTEPEALKAWLADNFPREAMWLYVRGGWVQSRKAPPGEHLMKLDEIYQYEKDGDVKWRMTLRTVEEDWTATIFAPTPVTAYEMGEDPSDDLLKISWGKWAVGYLEKLGVDWEDFTEQFMAAPKLWPRPGDDVIPGFDMERDWYFSKYGDISQEVVSYIAEHGAKVVSVEVEEENGNLWLKRDTEGRTELAKVVGGTDDFKKDVDRFMGYFDLLTDAWHFPSKSKFFENGRFTDEGRAVARGVLVPIVHAWPWVVTAKKDDGKPEINVPPTKSTWEHDGVAAVGRAAELMAQMPSPSAEFVDSPERVVEWARENVPELNREVL